MRPWAKKHPVVFRILLLVAIFAIELILLLVWRRPLGSAALQASLWTGIMALLGFITFGSRRKTERKLEAKGQILAYIRYPNSPPGSLSGIWNQGVLTPSIGALAFQPAVYDTLEPSGRATYFVVLDVAPERRTLRGKDARYIGEMGLQAISATTDQDVIDIAASPASLQKIIDRLAPPSEATGTN
jgi:hypothetical protein